MARSFSMQLVLENFLHVSCVRRRLFYLERLLRTCSLYGSLCEPAVGISFCVNDRSHSGKRQTHESVLVVAVVPGAEQPV